MKKLTALILTLSMLLSLVGVMPVMAEDRDEDREAALDVRYTTIDTLNLPLDVFAKDTDFTTSGWYKKTSTSEAPNILAYKGYRLGSTQQKFYPATNDSGALNDSAFRTDALKDVEGLSEKDGKYTYTLNGVPFALGTIASEAGNIGNNAYIVGAKYDNTKFKSDTITLKPLSETAPAVYKGSDYAATVTYTIDKSGVSAVNLLMTDVYQAAESPNKISVVSVKYEGESSAKTYYVIPNSAKNTFANNVFAIKKSDYEDIKNNNHLDAVAHTDDITLDQYKELVKNYVGEAEAEAVTKKPGDWSNTVADKVLKGMLAESKYMDVINLSPAKLSTLVNDLDESKFASLYQKTPTIVPTASGKFVPSRQYQNSLKGNYDNYVSQITIPTDDTKKIENITWKATFIRPKTLALESGGFVRNEKYQFEEAMLMLSYNGSDTITVNENGQDVEYVMFLKIRKQSSDVMLFGATVTNAETTRDRIDAVDAQLAAAETKEDILSALDAMKALIDDSNGVVLATDFDTASATAKLNEYILADIEAAKSNAEVDAIEAQVDGYASAYSIDVAALKAAIAEKKAEFDRVDALDDRDEYYFEIPYNLDAFATFEEILEYGVFEKKVNNAYVFPVKDWKGNPLSADGNWLSKKGFANSKAGTVLKRPYFFLIDSIEGIEGSKITASAYYDTNYTFFVRDKKTNAMTINGNDKMVLQKEDADGTKHYKLDAGNVMYKLGPIGGTGAHRTADGGYNVMKLGENENYTFERTQEKAEKLSVLFAYSFSNDGETHQASFEKVVVNYNDGHSEEKYIILTTIDDNQSLHGLGHHDSDRLGKIVVAVPKTKDGVALDLTDHSVVRNNFTYLTTGNDTEIAGIDVTLDDVIFPGNVEVVKGESVPVADQVIGSNAGVINGGELGPGGYVNHFTFDFGEDVESIVYTPNLNYGKNYAKNCPGGLVSESNTAAFIPVTIPGASEEYVYYAKIGRVCGYTISLMAATSYAEPLMSKIEDVETELAKITTASSIEDAAYAEELLKKITADGKVKESDFNAEVLATFKANLAIVKEKANVSGTIEMTYVAGTKPVANVTINNLSGLAGKKCKVIIACYDESENLLGTTIEDCTSTTEKTSTFTVEAKNLPNGTKLVKGFIWKDFTTLIPLAAADEAAASSYALDSFFDTSTGEYIYDESGELNVVFIGDSLTQGASTYDGDALSGSEKLHWTNVICEYFAEKTGKRVNLYNAGVGGVQTSSVAKMVSQTAEDKNADIVFIENVNDLNTNTTNSQKWTENLVRSLSKLDKKPVVILAHAISPFQERDTNGDSVKTVAEGKEWQIQHANAKDVVAKAYNLASVDYVSYYYENTKGFDTNSDWMLEDYGPDKIADKNVHPLTAGYTRFGKYIVSQIDANPSAYITRITPAEDVEVIYKETADLSYKLTYPTSQRFTYYGFKTYTSTNKLTGCTTKDAEYLVDWKYDFPHGGAAQAITTSAPASFEFTTSAKAIEIVHSSPAKANRRADFVVYVDGVEKVNNTASNQYENVLSTTSVELDGQGSHKIKVEVKQDSTGVKNVFNFAYLVEQK